MILILEAPAFLQGETFAGQVMHSNKEEASIHLQSNVKSCAGVNQWDSYEAPKYMNNTHLSARVGKLNPSWNEDQSDAAMNQRFQEAMALTGAEFSESVEWISKVSLRRSMLVNASPRSTIVHNLGESYAFL